MVSFTHGTEVFRGDAPSEQPAGFEPGPVAGTARIVRWFLRLASVGGQDGAQRV